MSINAAVYDLIKSPIVSEKATLKAEKHNQFTFKVAKDATKAQIKQAVESFFNVEVKAVNTSIVKGKRKRFKDKMGRRKGFKKAYVSLKDGHDINFAE